mmetsp:Transcript_96909/g.257538  ORF Transcript_96909/g.257538 Transcript_96909/m.257538 type:complete len:252 (-) Transcript_96909:361-1116(-)|eukprot:CAMPEP_0171200812 /NCGR_PEP_ID=MMETSP0790-20130122/24172_1 /TAXON_ID=2925 /ORGANISM="Alexandrium catenella, Strain OF101" /LENGTH=251 /DNA_ID=CAMNT_0011666201 /DNA_START=291 /DNA_END=1046 /DNA_ORIENTATION=+
MQAERGGPDADRVLDSPERVIRIRTVPLAVDANLVPSPPKLGNGSGGGGALHGDERRPHPFMEQAPDDSGVRALAVGGQVGEVGRLCPDLLQQLSRLQAPRRVLGDVPRQVDLLWVSEGGERLDVEGGAALYSFPIGGGAPEASVQQIAHLGIVFPQPRGHKVVARGGRLAVTLYHRVDKLHFRWRDGKLGDSLHYVRVELGHHLHQDHSECPLAASLLQVRQHLADQRSLRKRISPKVHYDRLPSPRADN